VHGADDGVRCQADEITDPTLAAELKKKRTFRTFSYRGIELDKLLDLSNEEVCVFFCSSRVRAD
jgi:hypothetical protein